MSYVMSAREACEGDQIRVAGIIHLIVAHNVDSDDVVRMVALRVTDTGSVTMRVPGDTPLEIEATPGRVL
jgi:hypothetical protein